MLGYLATSAIPFMIIYIITVGLKEKLNVYELFISGVIEGLKMMYKIFPYILAIIIAVGLLNATNTLGIIMKPFENILQPLGIQKELLPIMLLRPISGSAATAMAMNVFTKFGPDSNIGKIVSIIMGGTETTFYTITILFTAIKTKSVRGTLIAGLLADLAAMVTAVIIVNLGMI